MQYVTKTMTQNVKQTTNFRAKGKKETATTK